MVDQNGGANRRMMALQKLYEGSGSQAEIQGQVEKIASLAEQLPGEVVLDDEAAEGSEATED